MGKEALGGVPIVGQRAKTQLVSMRMRVPSLASFSGLRVRCCRELWCKSQAWLESSVAIYGCGAGQQLQL